MADTKQKSLHEKLIAAGGAGMGVMVYGGKDGNGYDVIDPDAPQQPPEKKPQRYMNSVSGVNGVDLSAQSYFDFD